MGWNTNQRRLFKRYKGKLHFVSPKQLGTEPTTDASRTAANEWWDKKRAEIDRRVKQHPAHILSHYQQSIENWRLYGKGNQRYGGLF